MKICYTCNTNKPLVEFNKNKIKKDGLNGRCRDCSRLAVQRSRAGLTKKADRGQRFQIDDRTKYLQEIRNVPCSDCVVNYPHYVMDFDHLPQYIKKFTIMSQYKCKSWDAVLAEIEKCEIVCANCHRIRTFERRQHNDVL